MENTSFMRVEEVAQELGISKSYAYKIVQKLNEELKSKGFLTISGRVNKQYFMERTCYGAVQKERYTNLQSVAFPQNERRLLGSGNSSTKWKPIWI